MQDLSDFVLYFLKQSFNFLQDLVISTGQQYFDTARTNFLLAFGVFMATTVIFVIIIGFVGFRKAKQSVLDIQNMLILMPLDELQPGFRQKIENYLNG